MDNIWIIVFVFYLFYKLFVKSTQYPKKHNNQWEDEDLTREDEEDYFPLKYEDQISQSEPVEMMNRSETLPNKTRRFIPRDQEDVRAFIPRHPEDVRKLIPRNSDDYAIQEDKYKHTAIKKIDKEEVEQQSDEQFLLFDPSSLLNGLIISELLQPPKCKRNK